MTLIDELVAKHGAMAGHSGVLLRPETLKAILRPALDELLGRCAIACRQEEVDAEATGDEADRAYNMACGHCEAAIRALGGK